MIETAATVAAMTSGHNIYACIGSMTNEMLVAPIIDNNPPISIGPTVLAINVPTTIPKNKTIMTRVVYCQWISRFENPIIFMMAIWEISLAINMRKNKDVINPAMIIEITIATMVNTRN